MSLFKNKTALVAATEFVIIVAGVLVALAADAAVDARRERALELGYLVALRDDVRSDLASFDEQWFPGAGSAVTGNARIRAVLADRVVPTDSVALLQDFIRLINYGSFDGRTSTVEDLLSTGRLQLVESQELRDAILGYHNRVEDMAEVDAAHRTQVLDAFNRHLAPVISHRVLGEGFRQRSISGFVPSYQAPDSLRHAAARSFDGSALADAEGVRSFLAVSSSLYGKQTTMYEALHQMATELERELSEAIDRLAS